MPLWGADSASEMVNQFCKMDYDGFRTQLGHFDKIQKLMEAGENYDEPGWDIYIIISGYKIIKQSHEKDGSIVVTVRYSELAIIDSTPQIEKNKIIKDANFTLVKIHDTWKIRDTSDIYPMISKDSANKWIKRWHKIITDQGIYQGRKLSSKEKSDLLSKISVISETIYKL
jgi:hypothetical protein